MTIRAVCWALRALALLCWVILGEGAPAQMAFRVGTVTLKRCVAQYQGYCGSIQQPLDRDDRIPGTVTVAFELYPHTDKSRPPLEPIIAQEGIVKPTGLTMLTTLSVLANSSGPIRDDLLPDLR